MDIVIPERQSDDKYVEYGIFGRSEQLRSVLLPHSSMDVHAVFDAE